MTRTQNAVYATVAATPGMNYLELAQVLEMPPGTVGSALSWLQHNGYVRKVGGTRPATWESTTLVAEQPQPVPISITKDKKAIAAFLREYKRMAAENQQLKREIKDLQGFLNRFAGAMRKGRVYPQTNGNTED